MWIKLFKIEKKIGIYFVWKFLEISGNCLEAKIWAQSTKKSKGLDLWKNEKSLWLKGFYFSNC